MNQDWDANGYVKSFGFVPQYGQDVMRLLDYERIRTLLDLGCGNGALTARLLEQGIRVIGMDSSASMLAQVRQIHPTIHFLQADATSFALSEPVDAVFSNAVLHWIDEARQPAALQCIYRALVPGGQFVFEMGGSGCNQLIHGALAAAFLEMRLRKALPAVILGVLTAGCIMLLLTHVGINLFSGMI